MERSRVPSCGRGTGVCGYTKESSRKAEVKIREGEASHGAVGGLVCDQDLSTKYCLSQAHHSFSYLQFRTFMVEAAEGLGLIILGTQTHCLHSLVAQYPQPM